MTATFGIALWGAVVATLVLIWDIVKWLQNGPKIKSKVTLNVYYDDGRVISREKIENGEEIAHEKYCHVEHS